MNRNLIAALLVAIAIALGCALWSYLPRTSGQSMPSLTVYCAAGLKKPVEIIVRQYGQEHGVEVALQYGATGTLLSQLKVAKRGDIFIAADDASLTDARKLGLIAEAVPIAVQHPVIAVKTGNPKNIRSVVDLTRSDVKLAIANPDSASVSKVSRRLLAAQWDAISAKATVMKPTVTEIAMDLQIGTVDAAILWDSTVPQFKGLEVLELPELTQHRENASAAVLTACTQPQEARKLAHYLATPDQGGKVFLAYGFQIQAAPKAAAP